MRGYFIYLQNRLFFLLALKQIRLILHSTGKSPSLEGGISSEGFKSKYVRDLVIIIPFVRVELQ
jgi:hypothetical protein